MAKSTLAMRQYRFLRLFGVLYLIGGLIVAFIGVFVVALGVLQFLQPYSVDSNLSPQEFRGIAFTEIGQGVALWLAAFVALSVAQLIELLFEIRARLAGTYVEPQRAAVPSPAPTKDSA